MSRRASARTTREEVIGDFPFGGLRSYTCICTLWTRARLRPREDSTASHARRSRPAPVQLPGAAPGSAPGDAILRPPPRADGAAHLPILDPRDAGAPRPALGRPTRRRDGDGPHD